MGRAFEVRKAAMAKGNLEKTKRYSRYGKEIAHLAKVGGADPAANLSLRRLIDEAKKAQIPSEIIERALAKAAGPDKDDLKEVIYEIIGPGRTTLLVVCLTDNSNRTLGEIRAVVNKTKTRIADYCSLLHQYTQYSYYLLDHHYDEELLLELLENNLEISKAEEVDGKMALYAAPALHHAIGTYLTTSRPGLAIAEEAIIYSTDNEVVLTGQDREQFLLLIELLSQIEDFGQIYTDGKDGEAIDS